jgi:hypothetical protein
LLRETHVHVADFDFFPLAQAVTTSVLGRRVIAVSRRDLDAAPAASRTFGEGAPFTPTAVDSFGTLPDLDALFPVTPLEVHRFISSPFKVSGALTDTPQKMAQL